MFDISLRNRRRLPFTVDRIVLNNDKRNEVNKEAFSNGITQHF